MNKTPASTASSDGTQPEFQASPPKDGPSFPSQESLRRLVREFLPHHRLPQQFRMVTDTSEFIRIEYDDVVLLNGRPYLILHNAKELRFGLEDEVKYWVKRAIDLQDGSPRILKLVFYETYTAHVGAIAFECFRSPRKEARILELVATHPNFMHGTTVEDPKGNLIRILEVVQGPPLSNYVTALQGNHESYFHDVFPDILDNFIECVEAIRFLHENGEKHGDIRRDHILVDKTDHTYRWIDFDFNYRHRENIYGYDLFGLGNVLAFLVGKGDVLVRDLRRREDPASESITEDDLNIVFESRVVNLKKIFPYIPEELNRILLHFTRGARWYYEHTNQLLEDLRSARLLI